MTSTETMVHFSPCVSILEHWTATAPKTYLQFQGMAQFKAIPQL